MNRYQDIYPSEALLRSHDVVRPRASDLITLEYFEAEPAEMPTLAFADHHILINLNPLPHRVENWRSGVHRDFTYQEHEVVVTPAGMTSGWRWHAKSRVIVVTIDPAKLDRFARSELGLLLTDQQLCDAPRRHDPDLCATAMLLLDGLRLGGAGSEVMFESLSRVFLIKLIHGYGEERGEKLDFIQGFGVERYKRVLDHLTANFSQPITIDDLAREAGLSTAHFARLFKQVVGDTPYQFIMDYRVEQAKKMLAEKARPLIDVALSCGFADQPHFGRVFKQMVGKTPRAWRLAI